MVENKSESSDKNSEKSINELNIEAFEKRIQKIEKEKVKAQKTLKNHIMDEFYDEDIKIFREAIERLKAQEKAGK